MRRLLIAFSMLVATPALAAADGAAVYKRCAACHLPSGAGVPGAYPPLGAGFVKLAMKPVGREFLVHVVIKGIAGPIVVEGKPYRGVMPAQSTLDDNAVAAVLNYVATVLAKVGKGFKHFSEAEVATARAGGKSLNAAAIGKIHAQVAK